MSAGRCRVCAVRAGGRSVRTRGGRGGGGRDRCLVRTVPARCARDARGIIRRERPRAQRDRRHDGLLGADGRLHARALRQLLHHEQVHGTCAKRHLPFRTAQQRKQRQLLHRRKARFQPLPAERAGVDELRRDRGVRIHDAVRPGVRDAGERKRRDHRLVHQGALRRAALLRRGPLRHERAVRRQELHRQPQGQCLSLHLVEVHGRAALPHRRTPRRLDGLAAARDRLRGRDGMRCASLRFLDRLGGAPHRVERRGRGFGGVDRRLGVPRLHVQLRSRSDARRDILPSELPLHHPARHLQQHLRHRHAARWRKPRCTARSDQNHALRQADPLYAAQPARGQDIRAADLAQRKLRHLHNRKRPHLVRHLQRDRLAGQHRLVHPHRRNPQAGHLVFPWTRARRAEPLDRGPCRQQGLRLAIGDRALRGGQQRHPARAGRRGVGGGRHARTRHVRQAPLRHRRPPLHHPPQGGWRG